MTDKDGGPLPPDEALDDTMVAYRAPRQKSLRELQELDLDDESLTKYKQALLGPLPPVSGTGGPGKSRGGHSQGVRAPCDSVTGRFPPSDPCVPNVQVMRLTLMSEQAPGPITMDLSGDLVVLKNQVFVLKEGVDYRVKITFKVNKEIVCGLRCLHHTYRKGLRVDKAVYMVGSYGPSTQEYEFVTPVEEAPQGALARGAYVVLSCFTDDDRVAHLSWEWGLHICKDWQD
ncbi:rho GDP-dissociation inhibitor 3 isoform X1 [Loxodonta africana]|uniref:rho GDP-dissociation inhibitor 3 isoform X1 n=1 Tax=Loxodonta africana TaxID=9785 RepID=UPI0030D5A997